MVVTWLPAQTSAQADMAVRESALGIVADACLPARLSTRLDTGCASNSRQHCHLEGRQRYMVPPAHQQG